MTPTVTCVGIDLGAVAAHLACLGPGGEIVYTGSRPVAGRPVEVLNGLLVEVREMFGPIVAPLGATGVARRLVLDLLPGAEAVNDVVASARGAATLCPGVRTVIEVGGHLSRWMALQEDGDLADFALSELCAAGAGAFLEQQAARLKTTVADLATLAAHAPRGATVAGRCTVFAKSDMIHLQQKGTPVEEIAYGLCLALARNFQASVLRGRRIVTPLAFVGGGTANLGLVRAFREVLGIGETEMCVPTRAVEAGAVGAALLVTGASRVALDLPACGPTGSRRPLDTLARFQPLPDPGCEAPPAEPRGQRYDGGAVILGVDVGSVSTNLALVEAGGVLVDAVYLPTRGRPLEVLQEGLAMLCGRHGDRLEICGVATTGSGRHLAGRFLGADLVRNEITAQLRAAAEVMPEIDTVLEIGGQDAKYIHARDGHIVDFTMNKVCAAGTGSFLEEQAERLGIPIIDGFARAALQSRAPVDLGSRCTVFMDGEIVHALRAGAGAEDLAAGLALAVVRNYLEKVVEGRPIGQHVLFQGGTASNRAVVAAFRAVLGRPVRVHPFNRMSGALGAALLLGDERASGDLGAGTRFRGVDACQGHLEHSFECTRCHNRCQVVGFRSGSDVFWFGDTCERYSVRDGRDEDISLDHPLARRQRLLFEIAGVEEDVPGDPSTAIGILRASLAWSLLPVWTSVIRAAGRVPVLSEPSSSSVLATGAPRLRADTCLPVKIAYGHAQTLLNRGVRTILSPSVSTLPRTRNDGVLSAVCPFTQHLPWMLKAALDAEWIVPEVSFDEAWGNEVARSADLAKALGISRRALGEAVARGRADLERWRTALRQMGDEILARAGDRVLVVIGKPYNVGDPYLNMDLGRHLARLGLPFLPMESLPLEDVPLDARYDDLPWTVNRDYLRAALLVREDSRLFPVVLSSFGCGPDGFTAKHLEEILEGRPRLYLELDEHRGEAGFVTRLEAFTDEISAWVRRRAHRADAPAESTWAPTKAFAFAKRVFLPYFSDHVRAFEGAIRGLGLEVVVMPPPDDESRHLGEAFSSGRECHPFTLIQGDMVRLVHGGGLRPGDAFCLPGGVNACLYGQYVDGLRHALHRLGASDLNVVAPSIEMLRESLGLRGGIHLWRGLVAVDLLLRATCERRPYEAVRGEIDRVHARNLDEIAEAVRRGEVPDALQGAVARLEAVAIRSAPRRPRVGVAGDIYTRINPFASGDLFGRLEMLGCEVWPAPFLVDNTDFNLSRRVHRAVDRRDLKGVVSWGFLSTLADLETWRVRNTMPGGSRAWSEPDYTEVLSLATPYVGPDAAPLVILNVAKMVDFAQGGAEGILNAICFGCLVGGVSAAILERVRVDHGGIPMATLAYGGTGGSDGAARLEAFVHQVERFHARRKQRQAPAR